MVARAAILLVLLTLLLGTAPLPGAAPAAPAPAPVPAPAATTPAATTPEPPKAAVEHLSFGRFGQVSIYRTGAQPKSVAVLLSGDEGWGHAEEEMARGLSLLDTLVIGVDSSFYGHRLERGDDTCFYPAGDLENLAKLVQKKLAQPVFLRPIVIGAGGSGALAYGSLAQAPPGTFLGAISLGFCPTQPLSRPLCSGSVAPAKAPTANAPLTPIPAVEQPWIAALAQDGEACSTAAHAFAGKVKGATVVAVPRSRPHAEAYLRWLAPLKQSVLRIRNTADLNRQPDSATVRQLANLPVIEMPAAGTGDTMAVVISGDGGWTGLDRQVASALVAKGMPVVALNTLQYFWTPRTPDAAGQDLARILRTYMSAWKRPHAIVLGYSLGAEVLPFMAARLPSDLIDDVKLFVLLGPGRTTSFEFRLSEMMGHGGGQDLPVQPELAKLGAHPVLCLYGDNEKATSLCTQNGVTVKAVDMAGGHYLGGDFHAIADQMIAELAPAPAQAQTATATASLLPGATEIAPAPKGTAPKESGKLTTEPFEYGRFGKVTLYHRSAQPARVVLLLSGDDGWTPRETTMATDLAAYDTLVIGVDIRHYKQRLAVRKEGCIYLSGSFELLSRNVQKKLRLERYIRPFVIGYAEGAELAYATLAQAPPNTFAGGLSIAFCPAVTLPSPLCSEERLQTKPLPKDSYQLLGSSSIEQPWMTLSGDRDSVCPPTVAFEVAQHVQRAQSFSMASIEHALGAASAWEEAFRGTYEKLLQAPPSIATGEVMGSSELPGLPVVEMNTKTPKGDEVAVILSGDGGWAGADRELAKVLSHDRGVPVVGFDTLQYFWRSRTPDAAASDLAKVIRHYLTAWKRKKVMLIGYSYGADVLPFIAAKLPGEVKSALDLVALIGPSASVPFEIRINEDKKSELQLLPEIEKIQTMPLVCVSAAAEAESLCPHVPAKVRKIEVPGNHGYVGQFGPLADRLLEAAQGPAAKPGAPAGSK